MLKILVSAAAIMAVMSTTAMACKGHKSGSTTAMTTTVKVLIVRPA